LSAVIAADEDEIATWVAREANVETDVNLYLNRDEIGLLLLIDRLRRQEKPLGQETLLPLAQIKLPRVAEQYGDLVAALRERGLIKGDPVAFSLTTHGEQTLSRVTKAHSLHAMFYNAYYNAARQSAAHALFCQRAYGLNLCQHGVADMHQIHLAIDALGIDHNTSLLDFGCGDGRITAYIARQTGASAAGIDIAPRAIALAQARTADEEEQLRFYCGDVLTRRGSLPAGSFDRILAVDSFFFFPDQRAGLKALLGYLRPGGQMGIFYLCPEGVEAPDTALGAALADQDLPYEACDLTAETIAHWRRKQQALADLKEMFYAEGNGFLFENRWADCSGTPRIRRYLYLVSHTEP
jgi:SAM-dependent methyltransferase